MVAVAALPEQLADVVALVAVSALPVTSPVRSAVMVPALKLPELSLKTTVDAVLLLVALDETVKVEPAEPS